MNETESRLHPLYRELIKRAEDLFLRASGEHCPDKREGVCTITRRECRFRDCPKLQEARSGAVRCHPRP